MSFTISASGHNDTDGTEAGNAAAGAKEQALADELAGVIAAHPEVTTATFFGSYVNADLKLAPAAPAAPAVAAVPDVPAAGAGAVPDVPLTAGVDPLAAPQTDQEKQAAADAAAAQAADDAARQAASEAAAALAANAAPSGTPDHHPPDIGGNTAPAPVEENLTREQEVAIAQDLRARADALDPPANAGEAPPVA